MNLPNLPTDNLYKFLALTGLFMIIIGFGFNQYREYQHDIENAKIAVGKENIDFKIKVQIQKLELLSESIAALESNFETLSKEKIKADLQELKLQNRELSNIDWFISDGGKLRLESELADASVAATERSKLPVTLFIILGFFSMISGFVLWYFKLQRYQDKILADKLNDNRLPPAGTEPKKRKKLSTTKPKIHCLRIS